MGEEIGAATIDLEWVQVHPTGLVKPDDADAKVKFLAAEALRGVGGILIDAKGERFANELGRRDYVQITFLHRGIRIHSSSGHMLFQVVKPVHRRGD